MIGQPMFCVLIPQPMISFHQLHPPVKLSERTNNNSTNLLAVGKSIGLGSTLIADTDGNASKETAANSFRTTSPAGPRIYPTRQRMLGLFWCLTSSCFKAITDVSTADFSARRGNVVVRHVNLDLTHLVIGAILNKTAPIFY